MKPGRTSRLTVRSQRSRKMNQEESAQPAGQAGRSSGNRTPLWVLVSVVVGFLLPVCSCMAFASLSIFGLSLAAGDGATTSTGFGDAVAIVRVEGVIISEDDVTTGAPSGVIMDELERAAADSAVKAIVLRVDSPGGTVTGSSQIHEAILELEKPVVASMGGAAASGGYYVSAPADYIFARPDTTTGSIGVIYTLFNAEELMDELGVDVTTITSGPNKDIGSPWDDLTPEQREIFETLVDESYDQFVEIVAEGRANLDEEEVRELADGRIYSGRQALENGLVDELGNLDDAIAKAAELGGISGRPRIVEYERIPDFSTLLGGFSGRLTKSESDRLIELIEAFTTPSLQYRYVGPGLE